MAREDVSLAEMYYNPEGDDPFADTGESNFSFANLLQRRKKKKEYDSRVEAFSEMSNQGDEDTQPASDTSNYTGLGTGMMGPNVQAATPPPPPPPAMVPPGSPSSPAFSGLSSQAVSTPLSMPMGAESSAGRVENLKTIAGNALEFLGEDPSRSVDIYAPGGNSTLSQADRQKIKAAFPDYSFWRNDSVEDFQEFLDQQNEPKKEKKKGKGRRWARHGGR